MRLKTYDLHLYLETSKVDHRKYGTFGFLREVRIIIHYLIGFLKVFEECFGPRVNTILIRSQEKWTLVKKFVS